MSAKKRVSLAVVLLERVEDSPEVDQSLLATLQKRSAELRDGRVKGVSTEEAYGFFFDPFSDDGIFLLGVISGRRHPMHLQQMLERRKKPR